MKAFVFPGQGSQFAGMGRELYDQDPRAKDLFEEANSILGFRLSDTMFYGSDQELTQTRITQPAIFVHSMVALSLMGPDNRADMVAGHSLGEISALVAAKVISFDIGLRIVNIRAQAMQRACETSPSTMAAILGLDDETVIQICRTVTDVVVPANFNSPGQIIISGTIAGVHEASEKCKEAGAKRAVLLPVGGAFHSPLMLPAAREFERYIQDIPFSPAVYPVVQNIDAGANSEPDRLKKNLIAQLTSPVLWAESVRNMIHAGVKQFIEVGPGHVLQGLIRKIDKSIPCD